MTIRQNETNPRHRVPVSLRTAARLAHLLDGTPGVERCLRWLHHPDQPAQTSFEGIARAYPSGPRYHVMTGSFLEWRLFFYGTLDRRIHRWLRANTRPIHVTFDVGANFGFFSLVMASLCCECHAFEPVPRLADRLAANVSLNDMTNVHCVRAAVSTESGLTTFYLPSSGDTNTGTGGLRVNRGGGTIEVRTLRLDDYVTTNAIHRVDIIKIDVEGAEDLVIEGAMSTIARHRPALIVEWNAPSIQRVFALLGSLQYACTDLAGRPLTVDSSTPPTDALFLPLQLAGSSQL
jgi:FkbM family methyltransferase